MKKRVVVYGLPRSGTNYLEFLVRNNIDCVYENLGGDKASYVTHRRKVSRKHSKPDSSHGDYFIIILKKSGYFVNSYAKWSKKLPIDNIMGTYKKAIHDYLEFYVLNPESTIIVFYEDLYMNEKGFIDLVCKKFDLQKKGQLKVPLRDKHMDTSGGQGYQDEKQFNFIELPEIPVNDDYNKIKDISVKW